MMIKSITFADVFQIMGFQKTLLAVQNFQIGGIILDNPLFSARSNNKIIFDKIESDL